ncbi:MAG: hypothetical protein ABI322_05690 [Gemmatimonadaceae bacterium]
MSIGRYRGVLRSLSLTLVVASVPLSSLWAQSSGVPQLSLFGGINAVSNRPVFADALRDFNVGAAADVRALPVTVRLAGEFASVTQHGAVNRTVIGASADVLSPSVGLFRGARLYAFGGPGVYRLSGYDYTLPGNPAALSLGSTASSPLLAIPAMTHFGLNAGIALDVGRVFFQAKAVAMTSVSGVGYFPVSIGFHF